MSETIENEIATSPSVASDVATTGFGSMAGLGMEGIDSSDQLIPFIRILHYACPQITEGDPGYIEGARPGMILNTATNELVDGKAGGIFIPVKREHSFIEFVPRDAGGGFVGVWQMSDPRIAAMRAKQGNFGKLITENGNELSETFSLFGLFVPPKSDEVWRVVCGFSSTQIKKYKMLVTRLTGLIGTPPKLPMWAHQWHIGTQPESNKKGKFFGWRFMLEGGSPATAIMKPSDDLVIAATEFYKQIVAGQAQANYESTADDGGAMTDGEDIPF